MLFHISYIKSRQTSLSPLCIENLGVYPPLTLPLTKMASFASLSPEPAAARFVAPPGCAPHLRDAFERAVNAHPPAWRREPKTGEVFEDLAEAERRLRCFSLVAGFDVVRASSGTKAFPAATFTYCYDCDTGQG